MEKSFRDLNAWKEAIKLAILIYREAELLPSAEKFGLASQMKRAPTSVASNIAEGYGRVGRGEYLKFLGYALGSLNELETHVTIAEGVGFKMDYTGIQDQLLVAMRLVKALIKSLAQPPTGA